ncbi:hypothetical protein [Qipengyuania spongiae]|uniref:Uncharacterized protein n=1 Tax=Qipengyuania spongiae TaxID=2909673 RepID=A0ABY5T432_9SPHN|nr:hypothetical protein [Qipengyuania spongiae]UVI40871.1 hypothetical protein L1F33_14530 [Qipengyuania spongiae]
MELLHALLGYLDKLVGSVCVFPVDDDVDRRLHVFEEQYDPVDVDRVTGAGKWEAI